MQTIPDKPGGCTCGFPETVARNPTGHAVSCPAYRRHPESLAPLVQPSRRPPDPRRAHERDTRERGPVPSRERRPG